MAELADALASGASDSNIGSLSIRTDEQSKIKSGTEGKTFCLGFFCYFTLIN
jgi:hypothetical protein